MTQPQPILREGNRGTENQTEDRGQERLLMEAECSSVPGPKNRVDQGEDCSWKGKCTVSSTVCDAKQFLGECQLRDSENIRHIHMSKRRKSNLQAYDSQTVN